MRLKDTIQKENFRIMALDDEQGIIDSLGVYLNKYDFVGYTDPIQAIEAIRNGDIEKPKFYKSKNNEHFEKRMNKMIEYLDKYIKE